MLILIFEKKIVLFCKLWKYKTGGKDGVVGYCVYSVYLIIKCSKYVV